MKNIIAKGNKRNSIVVAKGYRTAGATLTDKIYYKNCRGWMLEVEAEIRKGKAVALEDLAYMLDIAIDAMLTDQQKELKAAVKEYVRNYRVKAA